MPCRLFVAVLLIWFISDAASILRAQQASMDAPTYRFKPVGYWVELAASKDTDDRLASIGAMSRFPANADGVVPALVKLLDDDNFFVRCEAAGAIGQFGPDAKEAAPALGNCLMRSCLDSDMVFSYRVLEALAAMGVDAKEAIPGICCALTFGNQNSRRLARDTLVSLGSHAVPTLRKAVRDKDEQLQACAADALGAIGPPAKEAIVDLFELYNKGNATTRKNASNAIKLIDPERAEKLGIK